MSKEMNLRVGRREFLKVGSLGVLGVAALGQPLFAAAPEAGQTPPLLSVGYWPGVLGRNPDAASAAASTGNAVAAPVGDPAFITSGVVVRVRDFYLAPQNRRRNMSLSLIANFRPGYAGDEAPFFAWSYTREGSRVMESNPIRFTMPVDANDGARLALTRLAAAPRGRGVGVTPTATRVPSPSTSALHFTVGQELDRVKLLRGTYFLALRSAADQKQPDWNLVRTADSSRGEKAAESFLYNRGILDDSPVDFDYLVLEIEAGARTA